MTRMLSCGEAKVATFTINKMDIRGEDKTFPGVDKDAEFEGFVAVKKTEKTKDLIDKEQGKKRDIKIAEGARVLKIDSKKELDKLVNQYVKRSGLSPSFEKTPENILKLKNQLKKDYDGIYMGEGTLSGNTKEIFGDREGLMIMNKEVVYLLESKNIKSSGKGLSQSKNGLSAMGKEIDNEAYMKAQAIKGDYTKQYIVAKDKNVSNGKAVFKEVKRISNKLSQVGKPVNCVFNEGKESYIKGNKINVSIGNVKRMQAMYETLTGKEISEDQSAIVCSLVGQSKLSISGGKSENSERGLSQLYKKVKSKEGANIFNVRKEDLVSYMKEELHREKKMWDEAIKTAGMLGEDVGMLKEVATADLTKKTAEYLSVKDTVVGNVMIGRNFFYFS